MDVLVIIAKSRVQTGTSIGQKSDVLMLQDLNIIYKDIFSRLATKSKKYAWDRFFPTTTVVGQNEYTLPKPSITDTGVKRVLKVSIKYSSVGEFVPCNVYDSSIGEDSEYTNTNAPYCIQRDGSIFIYPAPTEAVVGGIEIEGQYIPLDLTLGTLSTNIKLASEYHDILLSGLNMWNFGDKQLYDKKALSKQEYEEGIARLIDEGGADPVDGYETTNSMVNEASQDFLP